MTIPYREHVLALKVMEGAGDNLHVMSAANELTRVTVMPRTPWFRGRERVVIDEPDVHSSAASSL